jgi:hypothetical protein
MILVESVMSEGHHLLERKGDGLWYKVFIEIAQMKAKYTLNDCFKYRMDTKIPQERSLTCIQATGGQPFLHLKRVIVSRRRHGLFQTK